MATVEMNKSPSSVCGVHAVMRAARLSSTMVCTATMAPKFANTAFSSPAFSTGFFDSANRASGW
jgi:hypothetical protein